VVSWSTGREIDRKGARTQLNPVLIRCEECVTGIFLETLRLNGTVEVNGPARRI